MNVLYDHQIFGWQKYGGISRYFTELIKNNPQAKLSLCYSDNIYIKNEYFISNNLFPRNYSFDSFLPNLNFKGKGRLFNCYIKFLKINNPLLSIKEIKKSKFDLFHPTYYNPYFLKYIKNKPFVLTIYDMIHEIFHQHYSDDPNTVLYKKKLIQNAKKIITISENTKTDILKYYPNINQDKISVIYLGSSFPVISDNNIKNNYILYVGEREKYKNFDNFIKAIAPLLIKYNLRLICTGAPFSANEIFLFDFLNISGRVTCNIYTTENELIELYTKAIAFVFPSFYEGFGIPLLEAFSTGCPAIISNTSSLPEIGEDAAVYFDPYSIEDIRAQIDRVLCSPALQKELIEKGKKRIKKFSWEKCAKETIAVYKKKNLGGFFMIGFLCLFFPPVIAVALTKKILKKDFRYEQYIVYYAGFAIIINGIMFWILSFLFESHSISSPYVFSASFSAKYISLSTFLAVVLSCVSPVLHRLLEWLLKGDRRENG